MTELGKIVKVSGKLATVRIGRHSACGECGKCGMGKKNMHVDFQVVNTLNVNIDDTVEIDIKETNTLKLSFFGYILPLLFGIALFALALVLKLPDWASGLLFFVGCGIAYGLLYFIDRHKKHIWTESPTLVRIVKPIQADNSEKGE